MGFQNCMFNHVLNVSKSESEIFRVYARVTSWCISVVPVNLKYDVTMHWQLNNFKCNSIFLHHKFANTCIRQSFFPFTSSMGGGGGGNIHDKNSTGSS